MSPLNSFAGRPGARAPQAAATPAQDRFGQTPQGWPQQQPAAQPDWTQQGAPVNDGYGQTYGYGTAAGQAQNPYGQSPPSQGRGAGSFGAQPAAPQSQAAYAGQAGYQPSFEPARGADPYAARFEPYQPQQAGAAASGQAGYGAAGYGNPAGQQPAFGGYANPQAAPQPGYGYEPASGIGAQAFPRTSGMAQGMSQAAQHSHGGAEPSFADFGSQTQDWQHLQASPSYGDPHAQSHMEDQGYGDGGSLEAAYEDEEAEFEDDYEPRSRRPFLIAAALAGAIIVGGGMAFGYKSLFGAGGIGNPPTIKSAQAPARTKPADPGGKQFDYSDRKILGRLGDGSSAGTAAAAAVPDASDHTTEETGTRKVSTLIVGRDGSIQAPAAAPEPVPQTQAAAPAAAQGEAPGTSVQVPGLTLVDGFGAAKKNEAPAAAAPAAPAKVVVNPPADEPAKPIAVSKVNSVDGSKPTAPTTGSIDAAVDAAPAAAPVKKKAKKVAELTRDDAAAPAVAAAPVTSGAGSGFVAVLASVPRSDKSRVDALARFADMQQKYASVLAGKTPDVAEANLGSKGNYHRLVVGPPGSREQASAICSQLKAQGYNECWVTSY